MIPMISETMLKTILFGSVLVAITVAVLSDKRMTEINCTQIEEIRANQ